MKNLNQKLHDALISYQLDLRRFEAGTVKKILATLDQMKAELVQALTKADTLTRYNKARKSALLKELNLVISDFYKKAQADLDLNIAGLAETQAKHAAKILEGTVAVNMAVSLPSETAITRLSKDALIDGGPMAGWWGKLARDTEFKVNNAVRQGIAQGETNQQIITRVRGKRGTIGALDSASHNIAALVQTATQTVANDSRLSVFEANRDIIKEVIWFSAMDGHVCPRCIALSGRKWKNTEGHEPVGHPVAFRNPPIHWNDRCVLLPVTKTFRELGVDIDEVPEGQRASRDGPIAAKTTFDEFLSRQPKEKQDEQLGAGRADMWREGKITLSQLIDGKGRELTLAELKAKYD